MKNDGNIPLWPYTALIAAGAILMVGLVLASRPHRMTPEQEAALGSQIMGGLFPGAIGAPGPEPSPSPEVPTVAARSKPSRAVAPVSRCHSSDGLSALILILAAPGNGWDPLFGCDAETLAAAEAYLSRKP